MNRFHDAVNVRYRGSGMSAEVTRNLSLAIVEQTADAIIFAIGKVSYGCGTRQQRRSLVSPPMK